MNKKSDRCWVQCLWWSDSRECNKVSKLQLMKERVTVFFFFFWEN